MASRVRWVSPELVKPPFDAYDLAKVVAIEQSMASVGYVGRPILACEIGGSKLFQALTGSHRLAAAKKLGLERVPLCVLTNTQLGRAARDARKLPSQLIYELLSCLGNDARLERMEDYGIRAGVIALKMEIAVNRAESPT